jgi:arylsulfatase A-like enzyme
VSGQYPSSTGVISNAGNSWGVHPLTVVEDGHCFTQLLSNNDFQVNHVGKWHLDAPPTAFGAEGEHLEGFIQVWDHPDYQQYLDDRGLPYFDEDQLEQRVPATDDIPLNAAIDPRPPEAGYSHYLADRAIERIEAAVENNYPFYLGTHFFGPHRPCILPQKYYEMYDPDDVILPESTVAETFIDKPEIHKEQHYYWGMDDMSRSEMRQFIAAYRGYATYIDEQVGRIIECLEEHGLRDSTAVAFSSDHGGFVTRHKLNDKGPAMYEDIYSIPFIIDVPGFDAGDHQTEEFVSLVDWAPTVLDLADIEIPQMYEGFSLLPLLRGKSPDYWRDEIVCEFNGHHYPFGQRMIRSDQYKLVCNPPEKDELYDLSKDPNELHNRIQNPDYEEIRRNLYDQLGKRLSDRGDSFAGAGTDSFPRIGRNR